MVVCEKCGNQFDENFNICPMCGTKYGSDSTVDTKTAIVQAQQPTVIIEKNSQNAAVYGDTGAANTDVFPTNAVPVTDNNAPYIYNSFTPEDAAYVKPDASRKGKSKSSIVAFISVAAFFLLCAVAAVIVIYTKPDLSTRIQEQVSAADEYMENKDYEAAVQEYKAAIENDSTDPELYLKLADAYTALNDRRNTIKTLKTGYLRTKDETIKKRLDELASSRKSDGEESSWYDYYSESGRTQKQL